MNLGSEEFYNIFFADGNKEQRWCNFSVKYVNPLVKIASLSG